MVAIRNEELQDTGKKLSAIIQLIAHSKIDRVILFATATSPNKSFSESDGNSTNLPLVAALAECKLDGFASMHFVFDGPFLTAVRSPRYGEVRVLLDTAVKSQKVYFARERAPFTSALSPDEATAELLKITPLTLLTEQTRADYFSLLSSLKEHEIQNL